MLKGTYKDVFPKMLPARNWDPQRPSQPTIALPCPKQDGSKKPKTVLAGMILSATPGATEWTLGVGATTPSIVAVAQDGTYGNQSMNVKLADSLVGLPCTGNFRICTPFYKRGVAYATGTALTYATDADVAADEAAFTAADGTKMAGCVRPAAAGEPVIGYVVRSQNPKFYGIVNYDDPTGAAATNTTDGAFAMRKSIDEAVCSLALSENSYFIEYDTAFQPEVK